jgi:hypothetical protein
MRILHCTYMQLAWSVLRQSVTQTIRNDGCPPSCVSHIERTVNRDVCPTTATLWKGHQVIRTYCTLRRSPCTEEMWRGLADGLSRKMYSHVLLTQHTTSSVTSTCTQRDSTSFFSFTIRRFKHTSVRLPPIGIWTPINCRCNEKISVAKTIHEMHIRIFCIRKSGHFCRRHSYCQCQYCPNPITALDCLYFHTLSIVWTCQNTTYNTTTTWKMSSLGNGEESEKKKSFTFSALNNFPNNFLTYCTRALNHPE